MKFLVRAVPFSIALTPVLALAQFGGVDTFFDRMLSFINGTLVPFVFAIAFLVFVWGIFKYFILGGSDQSSREEGQRLMLYGIAGFVVMVSVWGIVNLLSSGLGFSDSEIQNIPNVPRGNY